MTSSRLHWAAGIEPPKTSAEDDLTRVGGGFDVTSARFVTQIDVRDYRRANYTMTRLAIELVYGHIV